MENMLEIIGILLTVKGQLEALAHDQSGLAGLVSQCEECRVNFGDQAAGARTFSRTISEF